MSTNSPAISDYGMIGNTRTAALISKHGSIDWCCFPQFDSNSVFAAILDQKTGGRFQIVPAIEYSSSQRYLPDTNILETTFETGEGIIKIVDFFPVDSEENKLTELWPQHEILRIVEGVSGDVPLKVIFNPTAMYGKKDLSIKATSHLGLQCIWGSEAIYLQYEKNKLQMSLSSKAQGSFRLKKEETTFFSLVYSNDGPAVLPPLGSSALERLARTTRYWQEWISKCTYQGAYQEQVRRSALALKLLVYAPSGAILAAPTTSLPEEIGGVRNWDYRYCWLRDASFTIRALVQLGFNEEARAFVSWMLHSTHLTRPRLQILYSVYGNDRMQEKVLSWPGGFNQSRPVRIGNEAIHQLQLDVYGEVLDAIHYYSPSIKDFDHDTISFLIDLGNVICELWEQPDHGIWEVRSERVQFTHSKVMAWVSLDRLIKLIELHQWKAPLDKFREVAHKIKESIESKGFNQKLNSYTRSYDSEEVDASLLVLSLVGYVEATSERMLGTIKKIKENLTCNHLVYRYKPGEDGVAGSEGSFAACTFWLIENLARSGEINESIEWFEKMLKRGNSNGLWPEEIDPANDEFLGNYPQAFTHTALIGAALTLHQQQKSSA